jgi:hypothetical protein
MTKFATFSNVTDNNVTGHINLMVLCADKLPALLHGMEQWELRWVYDGRLVNKTTVKCGRGRGALEARAIMLEAAGYWTRKATELSYVR